MNALLLLVVSLIEIIVNILKAASLPSLFVHKARSKVQTDLLIIMMIAIFFKNSVVSNCSFLCIFVILEISIKRNFIVSGSLINKPFMFQRRSKGYCFRWLVCLSLCFLFLYFVASRMLACKAACFTSTRFSFKLCKFCVQLFIVCIYLPLVMHI